MTLRVLNFNPGIRGTAPYFRVRVMDWAGTLWLCAPDVNRALGWHPRVLTGRSRTRLDAEGRGYALVPSEKRNRLTVMVSRSHLTELLTNARTRQGRMFRRWLISLAHVAEPGDAQS